MNDTRNQIIDLADEFIRTRGFNAFSYADIAGIMEVRNAAIHYHFPSKTDLGTSVIDRELETIARARQEYRGLPGDEQLKKAIETSFSRSISQKICLPGALTPEYITLPPPLQDKVRELCCTILDWMTACLEKGRGEGRLSFQGAAGDRALLVISGLLSSLLLSRVLGGDTFDRMVGQLLKDINAPFQVSQLQQERMEHLED